MSTSDARYNYVAIWLHWVMALIIISLLVFGHLMTNPETSNRFALYQWHKTGGITVLPWEVFAARFTHIAFYLMMIGMPVLGWAMVSASPLGIPTKLFGVIPWPHIPVFVNLEAKEAVAKYLTRAHHIGGKLIIVLILLHVGAALKHHFVRFKRRDISPAITSIAFL